MTKIWFFALIFALEVIPAHAADTAAIQISSEATESQSDRLNNQAQPTIRNSQVTGVSQAGLFTDILGPAPLPIHVSDFSMLMGPSFDNFSTSAPSKKEPFSGFGMSHTLHFDYDLTDKISIGPTLGMTQAFYSSSQGSVNLKDPSLRLVIDDVQHLRFAKIDYRSSLWFELFAPVNSIDRDTHMLTQFSAAYIPMLNFRGSRFFLSGVLSIKTTLEQTMMQTGVVYPTKVISAAQANYRPSRITTLFVMDHIDFRAGPQQNLPTDAQVPDNYRMKATQKMHSASVIDGIMTGARFEITRSVAVSPRLDWQVDQNINTTTVGINASFHLI
ncbi:MAG: hypothetical protein P4M08_05430 [Oligoflexia bacterium]|nr:hypothetical protein [Oligoflexia bacterium]